MKVTLPTILIVLVLMLIVSLLANRIDLWIAWTRLGDEEFYIVVAVVLYFLLPQAQQGLVLVLAVLLSGSLNIVLKYTFNVSRPPDPLIEVYGPSFPSGHAQVSSSFWSACSLITMNWLVAAISAVLVTGISLSRIFLRAHHMADVVMGAILGLIVGYTSYYAFTYYLKKGSYRLYYVNTGLTAAMATFSMIVLSAELSSSTAILGLSLAILTTLPILGNKAAKPSNYSIITRIMACLVSVVLLLSIHLISEGFNPLTRLFCFYVAGLFVFATSLILRPRNKKLLKIDEREK